MSGRLHTMRDYKAPVFLCPNCGKPVNWPHEGKVVNGQPQHNVCPGKTAGSRWP